MKQLNDVTLIILVKEIEKVNIQKILKLKKLFDEVIIISDDYILIEGCNIFSNKFENFSQQRNYGISKSKNEKIIFLDEDEELIINDIDIFKLDIMKINDNTVLYFEYKENFEIGTTNARGILKVHRYDGYVHENIYRKDMNYFLFQGACISHKGYEENLFLKKYRNLKLLHLEYISKVKNSKFLYYYIKDSLTFFSINYNFFEIVTPEDYYYEFLEILIFKLPETLDKEAYLLKLQKNEPILQTMMYLKYNIGKPNEEVLKFLENRRKYEENL